MTDVMALRRVFLPRHSAAFRDSATIWFALIPSTVSTTPLGQRISRRSACCCIFQSKVNTQVVLSLIARSRLNVAHQNFSAHGKFQASSDAIAVTFGSDGADEKCVIAIPAFVAEQIGSLPIVADQDIQISIVVQIAHCQRAADLLQRESRAGCRPTSRNRPVPSFCSRRFLCS